MIDIIGTGLLSCKCGCNVYIVAAENDDCQTL